MRKLLLLCALLASAPAHAAAGPPADPLALAMSSHAVILMYHRFGEDGIPSTNIRLEQFDAQLAALAAGKYHVLGLPEIVARLKKGEPLPDRTVGLSADDAYASSFTEAWPRLKKAGLPFTLFVATEPVDQKLRGYLTWDQIRRMKAEGVTIGAHGNAHPSLPAMTPEAMQADLETSMRRFREELGETPKLFAWPFGEWDAASMAVLRGFGYAAAFGQHSGVAYAGHGMFWLPRFPMNEHYGSLDRLHQAVEALPLPVSDITPQDVLIRLGQTPNPPVLGFTVAPGVERLKQMRCYTGPGEAVAITDLGGQRFAVTPPKAFAPPRERISCTVPTQEQGRFRWFGIQFTVQK
ncbi:MAG TPA: polysaccharide deacetylase family protein [Ferrovibrio sp.]|uniref:polysaccharide deacetylase family protein n=1 Tax=Ferrovibrio sp. TaxID=1917215 RepID=UPI002ED5576C